MEGTFIVCAGWMAENPVIGELNITHSHGRERISFEYARSWLKRNPGFIFDPELMPYVGRQYPPDGKNTFGFLSDISPDRWGRKLMDRREIIRARKENRQPQKLYEGDYMLGVHDQGRIGGIRIRSEAEDRFLSAENELAAPPMTELRKLEQVSWGYENETNPYEEKWIRDLLSPGSSLGGARPKANVIDECGDIWIAKFPSKNDSYNVGAWEMVIHELACEAGILVPEARLNRFSDHGDTYLVKRFDRIGSGNSVNRIHFASAMTMLGETDGSENRISYLDLAAVIESISADADADLKQLWKRIAFYVMVSNTDDHLRNHGFLLTSDGWRLSPAYDINPENTGRYLSLAIDESDNTKELELVFSIAEYFRLSPAEADRIMEEMKGTISGSWRKLANRYHISREEQDWMAPAFTLAER